MEEQESILYVVLLAVTLFVMPGQLINHPLEELSLLATLGAIILIGVAIILIAVKNIPFFTPYIPIGLGDNIIKLLAWIGVLVVGILIVIINTLNYL